MVESIADQAALALENARLIEDVRESARRSELLALASSRMRASLDIRTIVETAAREYVQALNLTEAEVWLAAPDEPDTLRHGGQAETSAPPGNR
jgi:GAF domain-containing protein